MKNNLFKYCESTCIPKHGYEAILGVLKDNPGATYEVFQAIYEHVWECREHTFKDIQAQVVYRIMIDYIDKRAEAWFKRESTRKGSELGKILAADTEGLTEDYVADAKVLERHFKNDIDRKLTSIDNGEEFIETLDFKNMSSELINPENAIIWFNKKKEAI